MSSSRGAGRGAPLARQNLDELAIKKGWRIGSDPPREEVDTPTTYETGPWLLQVWWNYEGHAVKAFLRRVDDPDFFQETPRKWRKANTGKGKRAMASRTFTWIGELLYDLAPVGGER